MPRTFPFKCFWKSLAPASVLVLALLLAGAALAGPWTAGPEAAGLDFSVAKVQAGRLDGARQAIDLWIAFKNNEKALFLQELDAVEVEITGFWDDLRRSETLVRKIDLHYRPAVHPGACAEVATRLFVDHERARLGYSYVKVRVLRYWGRWSL